MQECVLCEDSSDHHQERLTSMSGARVQEMECKEHLHSLKGFQLLHMNHQWSLLHLHALPPTHEDVAQPESVVLPLLLWLLVCDTERRFLYGKVSCSSHYIVRWQSILEPFFRMRRIILNLGLVRSLEASDKKPCLTTYHGIFTGTDTQVDSGSNSP